MSRLWAWWGRFAVVVLFGGQPCWVAEAAVNTWIGGNADWVDNSGTANWSPADEPDSNDEALFNTANSVNLGSNNAIAALTMSGGIDLFTNEFALSVDGLVQLSGASTNLFVGGSAGSVNADNVAIGSGATAELVGGALVVDEESGTGLLTINAGGTLAGNGTLTFADTPVLATTLLVNNGALTALSRGLFLFSPPPVGTLAINDSSLGGRVDLDGASEAGVVNVNRNQTLDLNVPLADSFNGALNLFQEAVFDSLSAWTLAGGSIVANNGLIDNPIPNPDVPAGTSFIRGATLTQTGGVISIVDTDGALQFDAPFTMSGGSLANHGHLIFNNDATITAGAAITMPTTSSSLSVGAGRTVQIALNNLDLDGGNTATNSITVQAGGFLQIGTTDYDPDQGTNRYDGTLNLNSGQLVLSVSDAQFVMDGVLNMNRSTADFPSYSGAAIAIGNDAGVLDAELNVTGVGISQFGAQVDFKSDAKVNIALGATLQFTSSSNVNFDTVNGVNHAQITGAGQIQFNGAVNVNEAVTLNMVGGTVDLDGADLTGDLINIDAPLVINAATMAGFGRLNSGGGVNTLDVDARAVGKTGKLTVILDVGSDEWTLNALGVMNLSAPNGGASLLDGSGVNLNGTVNVLGGAGTLARVDVGGTVNVAAASSLTLQGGSSANPNRLNGGTINGPGNIGASAGRSLRGFGAINATVLFSGTAALLAEGGTLAVNGSINDVGTIGTSGGVLNVANAWNTNAADFVSLNGGELKGGTITNGGAGGISGNGLLSSRVINNTSIVANGGATLLVETAANDNDWDGAANSGSLSALGAGAVLELRDNATFGFAGSVSATTGGRVLANGFALDFNPGSTLQLQGSTYESTNSTDLGGVVDILAGAGSESTIKVAVNKFLTFEPTSSTTLGQTLRLESNNINIDAGATFAGAGALVIADGSHLVMDNGATANVLLVNDGTFRPGGFDTVGAVTLKDYAQAGSGALFVELTGTLPNQFDRLQVSGVAQLDGYLNLDIDGVFQPLLNQSFDIITSPFGVSGQFDQVDVSGMPAGKTFAVSYLPTLVRLTVVETPLFAADFDHDGDVDATDYEIWNGAFGLNQLGDATGDGLSNAADYTVWRDTLGSKPAPAFGGVYGGRAPEPSAVVLGLIAGAAGCLWRRAGT
ncbi:hypothetical protein Pla175_25730 [Pirellulimonas nuda]|uniref:Autotransporter-associated beta strand repeat protein n=1 Tax=Pirellulimonas nuda TaxID=2528009 RepID=A0A518DCN4_9BACT|nr:hypothetical protein [Pirellulimonas nuda]QDU89186.1 hypothetical protein Pla175_25730 [Pirellulimonas nuda]